MDEEEKLAIHGGYPIKTTPNFPMYPGALEIGELEKKYVLEVLESKNLFRYYGPGVDLEKFASKAEELEKKIAERMGTKYAVAVNSCTSALISALVACGVGPGCEVIVPSYTFFASCSAVLIAKAIPVIAEVDASLTMDPDDMESKITERTKAILPVHMRGAPCQMDKIMRIAKRYDLRVIEDVAQAMGGSYKGKPLGSFGDCGCFSLQYHKIITSGEGGIAVTNDDIIYDRLRAYHDSAACWRPIRFASPRYRGEIFPGENYRMNELTAAVALAQLTKLDDILKRMRERKKRIVEGIKDIPGIELRRSNDEEGDTGICVIFYLPNATVAKEFAAALKAEGVSAGCIYDKGIPDWHIYAHWPHLMHKLTATKEGCPFTCPYYKGPEPEYSKNMCPKTLEYLGRSVHINVPPQMPLEDCDLIVKAIRKVAKAMLTNKGR
ncbi:MAG: DegT/DnrJ/EryC1/StrS family aminotransferase [Candidatus Bathyarchaeia archaeon]